MPHRMMEKYEASRVWEAPWGPQKKQVTPTGGKGKAWALRLWAPRGQWHSQGNRVPPAGCLGQAEGYPGHW